MPFLIKLGPKNENCQFKLKFGTYTNSNMHNSIVIITFFLFPTGILLFEQIWSKKSKLLVSAKTWYLDKLLYAESIVVFTFSVLDRKHLSRQHSFLFCCGECVRGLFLCTAWKIFKLFKTLTNFLFYMNQFFA